MTPENELAANDLIEIGRKLTALKNAGIYSGTQYRDAIKEFKRLTLKCGFVGTAELAAGLDDCTFYVNPQTDRIVPASVAPLEFHAESVHRLLKAEASKKCAYLTEVEAPDALLELESRLGRPLEPQQEAFRRDLIDCLRLNLSRPAIVMAWTLGYDLIRSWVFNDTQGRLGAFNMQLSTTHQKGEPSAIIEYHNFFRIGEYRFLQICRDSQDPALAQFTDNQLRELQNLLDQRNAFGHANYNHASINEAIVYVERMIRIVTGPPFDK